MTVEEILGNHDGLLKENDPYWEYTLVENILRKYNVRVSQVYRYPCQEHDSGWGSARREIRERCPNLFKQLYPMYDEETTEIKLNRKIERAKPQWTMVFHQDREALWKREWVGEGNFLCKDYVVYIDRASHPKAKDFGTDAFRFNSTRGAVKFILLRGNPSLTLNDYGHMVTMEEVKKGRRVYKINKNMPTATAPSKEPNCEISHGYLKSTRVIEKGEMLTTQE